MTFEEYFEWEKKNVIYLGNQTRIREHFEWENTPSESSKRKKNTTISHCPHCGAPVNPYKEKCDYCGCYY